MANSQPYVLLVDDDPAMVRLLGKWLETAGYRVHGVRDGREAMAAIEAERPQFLVTDWEMPHLSGRELCCWLRAQHLPGYVYTVILTARSSSDDLVQGLESGADDFLRKPVNKDELLARLLAGQRVLELESRLNLAAKCDSLTGLYSQRTLFEILGREWVRSTRYGSPLSCVMVDIDYFKRVNDTYGHSVGDEAIRRVAKVLQTNTRSSDAVSRYGGEEFCILLPETTEPQAVLWAERIRRILAETAIPVGDKVLQLAASFGAAQRTDDTESPEELVDMADQALLVSKNTGRDRITAFQRINDSSRAKAFDPGLSAFQGLLARDVMTTIVAGLNQNEKLGRAVEYFLQLRINSAPVVDDDGRLVGVLSETDALTILLCPRWWETTVADVMKRSVVTYDEETSALTIYEFLCRVAIRSVVVVNDGRPTGVISRASLLRWFTNAFLARSETGDWEGRVELTEDASDTRRKIRAIAGKLAEHACRLERELSEPTDDLAPRLVGGASQMQELINDLLGYSRFAPDQALPSYGASALEGETAQGLFALLGQGAVGRL